MNKSLKAQIAAAFVAKIAFGSKPVRANLDDSRRQSRKRITGTLSLRH